MEIFLLGKVTENVIKKRMLRKKILDESGLSKNEFDCKNNGINVRIKEKWFCQNNYFSFFI